MIKKFIIVGHFTENELESYVRTMHGWCRKYTAINDYMWYYFDTREAAEVELKKVQQQARDEGADTFRVRIEVDYIA